MSRIDPSSGDIAVLGDILDLADTSRHAPSTAIVSEILRRLETLLGSDGIAFHAMNARDFTYQHGQEVFDGLEYVYVEADLVADPATDPGLQVLWDHWWASPCSLIERTGAPAATSLRSWYGQRRWDEHPVHREYMPCVDELIFGYPVGAAGSLRILAARESGPIFGERELTICRLVLPHLRDVLAAVVPPAQAPTSALTARQREILRLAQIGMSNRQIGVALGISAATVRTHLEHIYDRLGVTTRTAAVAVAFESARSE